MFVYIYIYIYIYIFNGYMYKRGFHYPAIYHQHNLHFDLLSDTYIFLVVLEPSIAYDPPRNSSF